jgi:hypothetical protein
VDDMDDGSNIEHGGIDKSDSTKQLKEELPPEDKQFKELVLRKLIEIRDQEIQPQLYDKERPERNPHIERANFIYALIFKVKNDFRSPKDVLEFVLSLEGKYPLAVPTIDEVKEMLKTLPLQS